jgi:hypothetical protein
MYRLPRALFKYFSWKTLILPDASPSSPARGAASDGRPLRACTSAALQSQ